jgi:hypothetical protein
MPMSAHYTRLLPLLACGVLAAACTTTQAKGPQAVLQQYIAAVEADQPAAAYATLDENVRRQMTLQEFVARWKTVRPELLVQAAQLRAALTKPISARAQIVFPSGTRATLAFNDNRWQIDEGIALSLAAGTPVDALKAFIRAVEQRSYESVMKLLAKPVRDSIERDITERITKLKQALNQEIEVTGHKARLQYDPRFKIELTSEEGQWRILDLD